MRSGMRRFFLVVLLVAAMFIGGCTRAVVYIHVDGLQPDMNEVRVFVSLDGGDRIRQEFTADLERFSVRLPHGRTGRLMFEVEAIAANGCVVARGAEPQEIRDEGMHELQVHLARLEIRECPGLLVEMEGDGSGVVTSIPDGISCPPSCSAPFPEGTQVRLYASTASGSAFLGWSGPCDGTLDCQLPSLRHVTKVVRATVVRQHCSKDGWCWENPLPQGNTLWDVCHDGQSGFLAIGEAGTLLKKEKSAWLPMAGAGRNHLYGMTCRFAESILAVGRAGPCCAYRTVRGIRWICR